MLKKKEITIGDLTSTINDLARMTATEFTAIHNKMATKQDLKSLEIKLSIKIESGFSLIMEAVGPMRRDYETLRNDLVPRMSTVEARLTKVERKTAI